METAPNIPAPSESQQSIPNQPLVAENPTPQKTTFTPPNKRVFKLIIVLVVINLVGFLGLQLLIRKKTPPSNTENSTAKTTPPSQVDLNVSQWKNFENSGMNLTFKYPGNWRTVKYSYNDRHEVATDYLSVLSGPLKNPETNSNYTYNEIVSFFAKQTPASSEPYLLLGLNGMRYKFNYPNVYSEDFIILEQPNDQTNLLVIVFKPDKKFTKADEIFDLILSTMKRVN